MQHIFIVGAKNCGAYGGYETFLDKLTEYHQYNKNIKYHIAWKGTESKEFDYHNAHCFQIKVPDIGPAQAIYYDVQALRYCLKYIKNNQIKNPIVYVLACRIGPFAKHFEKAIHKLGGKLYVNPDGHEWMRAKWSAPVRKYWKYSEQMMVGHCDLLVCDSKNIEKYIKESYGKYNPNTTFIAYGAETRKSTLSDNDKTLLDWYSSKNLSEKFLAELKKKTGFDRDKRIKFVGTVYEQELLKKIRENAYGYFHGHEVGGTNPSLLEALGSTDINLLLDVGFNREVAENSALYWTKDSGSLAGLIDKADSMSDSEIAELSQKAKQRINDEYSWQYICNKYEELFLQ